jgi:GDP-mannose 6-dehydrogenase
LAFKAGTDDLRDSPIIDVIERLLGKGFNVQIYDPHVHVSQLTGANRDYILKRIPFISRFLNDNLEKTISGSDLLVIVNNVPQIESTLRLQSSTKQIYDLTGVKSIATTGHYYAGISW